MNNRDFVKDIEINENDLNGEWIEHPSLVMYYNEAYAEACTIRDKNKSRLDRILAELDGNIRKNWEKHFDSKPTESAIRNYILLHPNYRKAEKSHIKSVEQVNIINGVRNAFEHRKKALENLVSLRITGFHSEPKNKIGGHEQQKKALNRKKKK